MPPASSGRHKETVQEIYQAFGRGDVAAILDRLEESVEWEYGAQPDLWYFNDSGRVVRFRHRVDTHQQWEVWKG